MLNKICDLEDQIENLNDIMKNLKEKVTKTDQHLFYY